MATAPPLVSVVTPFFNEERYLDECIRSVLSQGWKRFEYILADNGSTDRSGEICRGWAARDARIRYFAYDVHLPQIPNFNRALRELSPEAKYCKLVLGDDWIFPECLERMVDVAERNPSVAIVSSYRLVECNVANVGLPYRSERLAGQEVCRRQLVDNLFVFGSPTSLLFRADVVRGRMPFYREGARHADTEACYEILEHDDFGFVHQVLTFMRQENTSISSARRNYEPHILDNYIIMQRYGERFLEPEEYRACLARQRRCYYRTLAASLFPPREDAFWSYHRTGLAGCPGPFSRLRLAWAASFELADILFNPMKSLRRLFGKLRRDLKTTLG